MIVAKCYRETALNQCLSVWMTTDLKTTADGALEIAITGKPVSYRIWVHHAFLHPPPNRRRLACQRWRP